MSTLVTFTNRCYDLFWRQLTAAIETWLLGVWLSVERVFQPGLVLQPIKIDQLEQAAIFLDNRNRIVLANRVARQKFFPGKMFILGRRICAAIPWLDEAMNHIGHDGEANQEVSYTQNGERHTYIIQVTPVCNNHRDPVGRLAVLSDISRENHASDALAQAQLKTDLLAKVSHELRTPLTSVIGISEMLDYGVYGPLSPEQKDAVRLIAESTKTMTRLVNDLLEQIQLEQGSFALEETDFVLEDVVNRLRKTARPRATSKGLWLTFDVSVEMPVILHGDPFRLFQVVYNLVDNAIKYTPTGTVAVKFYRNNDDYYTVQVSDTGIGIPAGMQKIIFEPFQQIHRMDHEINTDKGFGLGLSIVKQLIILLNGEIQVSSEIGKGSVFAVKLPLKNPAEIRH